MFRCLLIATLVAIVVPRALADNPSDESAQPRKVVSEETIRRLLETAETQRKQAIELIERLKQDRDRLTEEVEKRLQIEREKLQEERERLNAELRRRLEQNQEQLHAERAQLNKLLADIKLWADPKAIPPVDIPAKVLAPVSGPQPPPAVGRVAPVVVAAPPGPRGPKATVPTPPPPVAVFSDAPDKQIVVVAEAPSEDDSAIALIRKTYTLNEDQAKALADFLKAFVKTKVLETQIEGGKLTVTTTPEVQNTIGQVVGLMTGKTVPIRYRMMRIQPTNPEASSKEPLQFHYRLNLEPATKAKPDEPKSDKSTTKGKQQPPKKPEKEKTDVDAKKASQSKDEDEDKSEKKPDKPKKEKKDDDDD